MFQPQLVQVFPVETIDLAETEADGAIVAAALFQGVLGEAVGYVDLADLDFALAGVADDLRGGIEAHRLRVEQRAAEGIRVVTFKPGRDVDELGKTRGMAFREAVGTEALDL